MKYIITDKGEVRTGGMWHQDMGDECEGRVIGAGHCEVRGDTLMIWGRSTGYNIDSNVQRDRPHLEKHFGLSPTPSSSSPAPKNGLIEPSQRVGEGSD